MSGETDFDILFVVAARAATEATNPGKHRKKRSQDKELSSRSKSNMPSASSAESLPSGSGSSTQVGHPVAATVAIPTSNLVSISQALVRETSGHSSPSPRDDCDGSSPIGPAPQGGNIANGPVIGKARALVDCTPSPYDKEALKFKVSVRCRDRFLASRV